MTEKFWRNVLKREDGHWIWQGSKTDRGYGRIKIRGKLFQATQLSLMIVRNIELSEVEKLKIIKLCLYKDCVNPACLHTLPKPS